MTCMEVLADYQLLIGVWPREQFVMGVRVCKFLNRHLLARMDSILCGSMDADQISQKVACAQDRFIRLKSENPSQLMDAWTRRETLGKCADMLIHLDLSNSKPQHQAKMLFDHLIIFTALTHLNLRDSVRLCQDTWECTTALGTLQALTHLNMGRTQPDRDGYPRIDCPLVSTLSQLTKLEFLSLERYWIGDEWTGAQADFVNLLASFPKLTTLDLTGCCYQGQGSPSSKVAEILSCCTHLQHLALRNNKLVGSSIEFSQALGACTRLKSLDLSGTALNFPALTRLALGSLTELTSLDVSHNRDSYGDLEPQHLEMVSSRAEVRDVGRRGGHWVEVLAERLGALTALRSLNVSGCGSGSDVSDWPEHCQSGWIAALKRCSRLTRLNLGDNRVDNSCVSALVETITKLEALKWFSMPSTVIRGNGVGILASGFANSHRITHLDLSWMNWKCQEASLISEGIAGSLRSTLQKLTICHNKVADAGIEALAPALGQCSSLVTLNMGSCAFEEHGATLLGRELGKCPALTELRVSDNHIKNAGVEGLVLGLGLCHGITHLDLQSTFPGIEAVEGFTVLAEALRQGAGASLHTLELGGNVARMKGELRRLKEEGAKELILRVCPALCALSGAD